MEENNLIVKKALVVEDDPLLSSLLARKLLSERFQVRAAADAPAAFAALEREKSDIVLLDLILPGMDGFEILTRLKADQNLRSIPVLILSNLGQQEDVDRAMSLGAEGFMIKANFTLDEIVQRVKEILNVE